ncbi:MAG: hypothetical protein IPP42_01925 [Saprospiraceae bacterium]|nr:hypothetical protein [Saprospiraceae bacterium]
MKDRILKGWTFHRVIYLVLGGFVMIQSALIHQWLGVALGLYLRPWVYLLLDVLRVNVLKVVVIMHPRSHPA